MLEIDAPTAKRARGHALDATVTTVALCGVLLGMFMHGDGPRLVSTTVHTILALLRSGRPALIAGRVSKVGFKKRQWNLSSLQFALPGLEG